MICFSKPRICTTENRSPKFCTPEPRICTDSVVQKKTGLQILGFTDIKGSTEFGISLFSSTDSGFWNTNHDFLIRSFVTMVENWYLILNFLPWSRNFLCKNHDLYFKTQNLYYWKEISQILYPRTQNLYYRFCSTEKKLGYRFWDLQILRAYIICTALLWYQKPGHMPLLYPKSKIL